MAKRLLEKYVPVVKADGLQTNKDAVLGGALTVSGTTTLPAGTTIGGSSVSALGVITSASANALTAGRQGATAPAFNVDASTGSQAAGLNVVGATAAGTVAVASISSGAAAGLSVDALGVGVLNVGGISTGLVSVGRGPRKSIIQGKNLATLSAQNVTPTAAQLLGGVVAHVSATGGGTCTLPIGTLLSGAVTGVAVGDSFECLIANTGNQTSTITGDTGSTVIGTAAVSSGKNAQLLFYNTGTNTWNVYVNVSA